MFGDSCAIKHVKYKMKTRHSTNSKKKHWNIKKKNAYGKHSFTRGKFTIYNWYIPSTLMKLIFYNTVQGKQN